MPMVWVKRVLSVGFIGVDRFVLIEFSDNEVTELVKYVFVLCALNIVVSLIVDGVMIVELLVIEAIVVVVVVIDELN